MPVSVVGLSCLLTHALRLKWLSDEGLSSLRCGWPCDFVTHMSAGGEAAIFAFIQPPHLMMSQDDIWMCAEPARRQDFPSSGERQAAFEPMVSRIQVSRFLQQITSRSLCLCTPSWATATSPSAFGATPRG
jgi:hypothetical protein